MDTKHRFINEWEMPDDAPNNIDSAPIGDILLGPQLFNDNGHYLYLPIIW